ncbi:MAG: M23 family metallopeptidase, partial [Nitrososphaerota archaeon]
IVSRPVSPAPKDKSTPVSLPLFGNERLAPGELIPKKLTPQEEALLKSIEDQVKRLRHPQAEKIKHYLWWVHRYVFQTSKPYPVTQLTKENPFRMGYDGRGHLGTDFAAPEGTPIYAPFEGYIILKDTGRHGWGKHLILVNRNNAILFGHLQGFNRDLRSGQVVPRGTLLGWTGKSGNVWSRSGGSGAHLDVTVFQINDEGSSLKMVPIQDYSYLTSTLQVASTTPILSNEVYRRYTELITNRLLRSGGVVLSKGAISESPYQSIIDKATAQSTQGQISAEETPLSSAEYIFNWLQDFWSSESGQKLSQGVLQETQKYFSSLSAPSSSPTPSGSASKAPAQSTPAQSASTFSYQPYIQGSTVTFSLASPDGGGGGGLFDLVSTGIKAISDPQDFFRSLGERATSVLTDPGFLDMATKAITDPKSFSVEGMAKHIIERSVPDYEISSLLVDLVSGKKPEELLPKYGAIFRNKSIEEAVSLLEQGLDTAINKAKELSSNNPIFSGVLNWLRSKSSEWIRSVAIGLKRNPDLIRSQAEDTRGTIDFISPALGFAEAPSEAVEFTKPGEEIGSRDTQEIDFIQPTPEPTTPSEEIDFIQPVQESTIPIQEIDFIQPEKSDLDHEVTDFMPPTVTVPPPSIEASLKSMSISPRPISALKVQQPLPSPPSERDFIPPPGRVMGTFPTQMHPMVIPSSPPTSPLGGRSESTFSEELLILLNTIFRV